MGQALVAVGTEADGDEAADPRARHDAAWHRPPLPLPPTREEIIYIVDGVAEQWVDRKKQRLKAGECAFIPKKMVHAIFNSSRKPMTFLAILSPAKAKGPFLVDCYDDEPWRTLRKTSRTS